MMIIVVMSVMVVVMSECVMVIMVISCDNSGGNGTVDGIVESGDGCSDGDGDGDGE